MIDVYIEIINVYNEMINVSKTNLFIIIKKNIRC